MSSIEQILNELEIKYKKYNSHLGTIYSSVFSVSKTEDICLIVYENFGVEIVSISENKSNFKSESIISNDDLKQTLLKCLSKIKDYVAE